MLRNILVSSLFFSVSFGVFYILSFPSADSLNLDNKFDSSIDEKNLRLGDRFFLSDYLINVFGESISQNVYEIIVKNELTFGGPCDFYEAVKTGINEYADPYSICFNGKMSEVVSVVPRSTIMRQAYIKKICAQIVSNEKAMRLFTDEIQSKKGLIDSQSVKKAFRIMNPYKRIGEGAVKKIDVALSAFKSEQTKAVILAFSLCFNPLWQIN